MRRVHGARLGNKMTRALLGMPMPTAFIPPRYFRYPGRAGVITTDDDGIAGQLRMLRNYGQRAVSKRSDWL